MAPETQIPDLPGIYIVTLSNETPISVNADRARRAHLCISVTKANCKYGIAKNLRRRRENYFKTFGVQHVLFRPIAVVENPAAVEMIVGRRIAPFRMRGLTGRPNEWLVGVSPQHVEAAILEALQLSGLSYQLCAHAFPREAQRAFEPKPATRNKAKTMPLAARSHVCGQIVRAAEYLKSAGMSVQQLRAVHHSPRQTETFASTLRYFSKDKGLRGNNLLFANRLDFIASEHGRRKTSLTLLIQEALRRWPILESSD